MRYSRPDGKYPTHVPALAEGAWSRRNEVPPAQGRAPLTGRRRLLTACRVKPACSAEKREQCPLERSTT